MNNGTEFFGEFGREVKRLGFRHLRTYPHSPKTNGCIERHNRTVQEEFVYNYEYLIEAGNMALFNAKMVEYVYWFNNSRPHQSLGDISPVTYMITNSYSYVNNLDKRELAYAIFKTKNPPLRGISQGLAE